MIKEKVLSGRYKDCPIVYDHIRSFNGEDIYFNSFSVMNMGPADQSRADYWSDQSIRVDGSTSRDADKDRRLISVEWRNGETSLLQVNNRTFNRLMEAMYGRVPEEKGEIKQSEKKKASGKGIGIIILIIAAAVIIKYLFF
jgi:hypothetical protein